MKLLNKEQLLEINGGLNVTGSILNSINNLLKTVLDIGRSVGTSIVRLATGNTCRM